MVGRASECGVRAGKVRHSGKAGRWEAGACAGKKGGRVGLAEGRRPRGLAGGGARAGSAVFWKAPEAGLRLPKRPKGLRRVQAGRTASARAWEGHSPSVGGRAAPGRRGPRGEGTWADLLPPPRPARCEQVNRGFRSRGGHLGARSLRRTGRPVAARGTPRPSACVQGGSWSPAAPGTAPLARPVRSLPRGLDARL